MDEPTPPPAAEHRRGWARTTARWSFRLLVAGAGAVIGILLLGRVEAPIGPFDASLALTPTGGGATVEVPPLGALAVDAYDGPLGLDLQLRRVDEARVQALVADPAQLDGLVDRVSDDLQAAVVRLAWRTAAAGIGGAVLISLIAF